MCSTTVVEQKKLNLMENSRISSEELGIAPHKKLKTESSSSLSNGVMLKSEKPLPQNGLDSKNTRASSTADPGPGRHLRFHSVEQDDFQSSSGNSSNVENENLTEEDSGNISDSSSHASSGDWQRRPTGVIAWVHAQMVSGVDPRKVLHHLVPNISHLPQTINDFSLWQLIVNILSEPQRRPKLSHFNTLSDVVSLISSSKNILVLTGAGVSVSCGIPDFRSRDGIYARLAVDFPDLPDPQAMFDIAYFMQDPRPFFKFAKEIYPGQFKPSRSHRFISLLQETGKLLRNYTQNIDTLEQVAGISRVIQCHGSFATASCLRCHHQMNCESIREDIFNQHVPHCPKCSPEDELAIMKPDIVFFGENLPEHFHRQMSKDKDQADLLIVIGSSLKVRPVALIPSSLPDHIPQILINREPLPHVEFDIELLGDGDAIVSELCRRLGPDFSSIADEAEPLTEIDTLPNDTEIGESQAHGLHSDMNSDTSVRNPPIRPYSPGGNNNNNKNSDLEKTANEKINDATGSITDSTEAQSLGSCGSASIVEPGLDPSRKCRLQHLPSSPCGGSQDHVGAEACSQSNIAFNRNETVIDCDSKHAKESEFCSSNEYKCPSAGIDRNMDVRSVGAGITDEKRMLWRSRWKQSISKRLPAGTFYYGGGHRYIFPGAEVAPEEEDDSELSDIEYDPDVTNDGAKSSSDDSDEEEPAAPGGLSSTRRDLRTNTSFQSFQHHAFMHCCHDHDHHSNPNDETTGQQNKMEEENVSSHLSDDEEETKTTRDPDEKNSKVVCNAEETDSISSFPADFSSHLGLYSNSPVTDKGEVDSVTQEKRKESILPDELHELITMDSLPTAPHEGSSRSHSPLPPNLHKILANEPLHTENPTHLLAKADVEVLDTDEILCLPSSSLLPPMENYAAQAAKEEDNGNDASRDKNKMS